ncbi:MAG: hypothetical protein ACXVX8_08300 [Blastococcus sp.]
MADHSEFETTPTAWQEIDQLELEDPPHPVRRRVDLVALVPGIVFVVLAVVLMTGVNLPTTLFRHGGVLWILLIGGGVALLIGELRRTRRPH